MEQADIDRVEYALGIKIPARHAQFLRSYAYEHPQDFLMIDADLMIFENRGVREHAEWDANFLVVGNSGNGDLMCLRLSPPSDELWIYELDPPDGFSVHMTREELEEIYQTFEQ